MRTEFERACALYREWNEKVNVVSRKDIGNIYEHHILHSLAIREYLNRFVPGAFAPGESVLDLGTGGGFPGIPLAVEFPSVDFTLCDSIGKKIMVAGAVAEGLCLSNVSCVCSRVESLKGDFDWVVCRAVASLDKLWPWIEGRYRRGALLLKGGDINEEISRFFSLTGRNASSVRVWPISEWLDDEYFTEKFVIQI